MLFAISRRPNPTIVSKTYISAELRRQVQRDAGYRCGYCRISEFVSATGLVVDHILPESSGGPTTREHLWMVCTRCGRATVEALRLNRELAVLTRRRWVSVGWHSPSE
jgi:5-methylcytosine-specific restriction endonuclease McrA